MPRQAPRLSPPPLAARLGDAELTREFELLTPLFGGGVKANENDLDLLVRGTAVRGNLRFWWRACRAGEFGTVRDLQRQENLIWGSVDTPAAVKIEVEITDRGVKGEAIKAFDDAVVPAYAAFPMTSQNNIGYAQEEVAFKLRLRYPSDLQRDVEAALWAWGTFGGLGARTRRGFGALQEIGGHQSVSEVAARLRDGHYVYQNEPPEAGIPSLYGATITSLKEQNDDSYKAWKSAIAKLREFRQVRRQGQNKNRPGRSFWGEPDRIRRLTNRSAALHAQPVNNVQAFARAPFGLPIIYQFVNARENDPSKQTLKGATTERLASPIILRPLRTAPRTYHGVALHLKNTFHTREHLVPGQLKLGHQTVTHQLSAADLESIKGQANLPAALSSLETDVLASFLAWFAK